MVMLSLLLLQFKVFLFIMSIFYVIVGILHTVSVFRFKTGKIVASESGLVVFGMSLSYIITMLICGF